MALSGENKPSWFKYAAKFLTAVVGVIALAVTQGLIEGTAAKWCAVIIAVLTASGVYVVPNASSKPT